MTVLLASALLNLLALGAASPFEDTQARESRMIMSFMERRHVPGLAYAILKDGSLVDRGTYGFSDLGTKERVTAKSIFPIASLSKPFVALGVLALAEHNSLDLQASVGTYLPDLPTDWKPIPLIRLLDHTSGVPDHYNAGKWNVFDPAPVPSDELIRKLTTLPLAFRLGAKFQYSNGNYALLAKVIERVSGMPYEKYLTEKVFLPLGMKSTKALTLDDLKSCVKGYETSGSAVRPVTWNPDWCYGNGALGATINDLARLDTGLYTERIVKFSTLRFISTPQKLIDGKTPGYAMGWGLGFSRGAETISHNGRVNGWRSCFIRYKKYNLTVIVVTNNGTPDLGTLAADLAGLVVEDLALDPIPDQNPALTQDHLKLVRAIESGSVDPGWLSDGLRKDWESKDHWTGISKDLKSGGEVTLFEPAWRGQVGAQIRTRYRLEQGDKVKSITIGCDQQGLVDYVVITS